MSIDARQNRESRQEQETANDRVQYLPGQIYDGVVMASLKDSNTCSVQVNQTGHVEHGCLIGRSIASALLGFQVDYIPPPGTKVKLVAGTPSVIVAMLDSNVKDPTPARKHYSVTGTDKTAVRDTKTFQSSTNNDQTAHTPPRDLLEGEFQISNALGVALTMLTTMAKLSAGDRAKVEVFLLEDMVRIISEKYRHFSAVGQEQIYDDGRPNARLDATSYTHEAIGVVQPKDERVPVDKNVVDTSGIDKVMETGRWRYSHFLGFLGDFFHLFVTDPVTTMGKIGANALRSGNAHVQIGSAGEILVQSVSEIVLERVVRIPVPIEITREDDPAGLLREQYEDLDKKFLELWKYDVDNPSKMVFQIREYARWLSTYHSLARFHQLQDKAGEWKVPMEAECPPPAWTAAEADKIKANVEAPLLFKDTYACMRIMRDGSIVHLNGEGGAMCLAGKHGYMSVPGNLFFEAGGDVRFTAGQSLYFLARRSMELVAVAGGIRMKARTWLNSLCERGSIWLKSDAVTPGDPGYVAPTPESNQMGDEQDPMPEFVGHGIFLDSPRSSVAAIGAGATLASVKKGNTDGSKSNADIFIQADKASVRGIAGGEMELLIRKRFLVSAGGDFILKARKALWVLMGKMFNIKDQLTLRTAALNVGRVKSDRVSAMYEFIGPEIHPEIPPLSMSNVPLRDHLNHIRKLPDETDAQKKYAVQPLGKNEDGDDDDGEQVDVSNRDTFADATPVIIPPVRSGTWDFEAPSVYQWTEHPFYETLSQQRIRTDIATSALYGSWDWDSRNKLIPAPYNGTNAPVVGAGAQCLIHAVPGKDLHKPSTAATIDDLAVQTPLTPASITFKFLKKNPTT